MNTWIFNHITKLNSMDLLSREILAPLFRFVMELITWILLILNYWYLVIPSMLSLGLLNMPGDKQPAEDGVLGLAVPGKVRLTVELLTAATGLILTILFYNPIAILGQSLVILAYLCFDFPRLAWLWGSSESQPEYVNKLHQFKN